MNAWHEIPPGTLFENRYRVLGPIGKGAMGAVLAAEDLRSGRRLAIKCLLHGHCHDSRLVARFRREARATQRLRSEHVAHVVDSGELQTSPSAPPIPYLVMEHLEGEDLRSVLRDNVRIPVEEAVDYVIQACAGLAEAHALGIVHRDLKPANLFLVAGRDGKKTLKILDFGVAKFETQSVSGDAVDMTSCGETVGSLSYMAPEQVIDASTVDARADIWSLGVVLYHLVSGEKPFDAETVRDVAIKIIMDAHAPLSERLGLPRGLDAVIHKCLQKRREHRFGSVVELARALAPFAQRRAQSSPDAQLFHQTARLPFSRKVMRLWSHKRSTD